MDVGADYTAAACMALGDKAWRELGAPGLVSACSC